jgi:hypothetical protein
MVEPLRSIKYVLSLKSLRVSNFLLRWHAFFSSDCILCILHLSLWSVQFPKQFVLEHFTLSERRAGEAWEPSREITLIAPPHSKVSLSFPTTFHFYLLFYYTLYLSHSVTHSLSVFMTRHFTVTFQCIV